MAPPAAKTHSRMRRRTARICSHTTPFSPSDLVIWKKNTPSFRSDSQTVIRTLQLITDNPSWGDMMQLFHIFLTKDKLLRLFKKMEEIAR